MPKRFHFVTTEYRVAADVPRELTFAFVSDLHGCPNAPVVEAIEKLAPDAVLVGGDFIHNARIWESGIEFLELAAGVAPTFAALGNHEFQSGLDVRRLVRNSGATLLDDDFVSFGGIMIGALSSGFDPEGDGGVDLRFLDRFSKKPGFKVLLCHHPEYYDRFIKQRDIDLTLSGHAHGGQWRFFGRGVYAPGQGLFPKYTSGAYDGGRLIVGQGLGNAVVVPRIFNAPQLVVIRIDRRK